MICGTENYFYIMDLKNLITLHSFLDSGFAF